MKKSLKNALMSFILLTSVILLSTNASAVDLPLLLSYGGNYTYNADTKVLSFNEYVTVDLLQYADGEYGYDDPILGTTLSFGLLMNSASDNLIFGPSPGGSTGPVDFSIDGFITATLDNFVVHDSALIGGNLYNIETVDGAPYSRYIDELLSAGGGNGLIDISFTPSEGGGAEDFTFGSYGAAGVTIGAPETVVPEPVSTVLFIAGGATLAFRRLFKK
ncbi:MAG: PEP-CTERM sorting domain-containing protein [Nitrospirae bacterium]|nr:PEP-CTERM sorting domain-containing protein [Nitrospirota bacterium]